MNSPPDVLQELRSGQQEALDRLIPVVYQQLRKIAHRRLSGRDAAGTLTTTALVHEAYLKLVDQRGAEWQDRAHFLALASVAMRHVLLDRAKAQRAEKRGGARVRIAFDDDIVAVDDQAAALLEIDDALQQLARVDARLARVVECRFYGGLSHEEIAEALGVTVRTVERDCAKARVLLRRTLDG